MTALTPEILAVVPARGGSKGIIGKNVVDLCGKPLLAYTLDTLSKVESISRVVVSTDDEEIAAVARNCGAEVPSMRPPDLAGDNAMIDGVIRHVLGELRCREGYTPDAFMVFYPTSPFRSLEMVRFLAGKLTQKYSAVVTSRKITVNPGRFVRHGEDGLRIVGAACRRTFFRQLGLAYGFNLRAPYAPVYNYTVEDPIQAIDIDTPADLELARQTIECGLWCGDTRPPRSCPDLRSVGSEIVQHLEG